jgi:hypothetical protein
MKRNAGNGKKETSRFGRLLSKFNQHTRTRLARFGVSVDVHNFGKRFFGVFKWRWPVLAKYIILARDFSAFINGDGRFLQNTSAQAKKHIL